MTTDATFLEKMRISDKLKQAIRQAQEHEGFKYECDAARWFLTKGAQLAGYLPSTPPPYRSTPEINLVYDPDAPAPGYRQDANGVFIAIEGDE